MLPTNNIKLRPISMADKEALAKLANNRKIWLNLTDYLPHPYTTADAIQFIEKNLQANDNNIFVIEYKGQFAGLVGLLMGSDLHRKSTDIGYWLGEPFWGKGITRVAVDLATRFAFENLDINRISAGIFEHNLASMRVLEKNGYQKEGILKKGVFKDGEFWDEHLYGLLKEDWLKNQGA